MGLRGISPLVGPILGLLVFPVGLAADWRIATTLIAGATVMFAGSAGVWAWARATSRKEEASE